MESRVVTPETETQTHSPGPESHLGGGGARFVETHWSVVLAAGSQGSPRSEAALEKLCRAYWYPLYAFVRRQGYREHDAKDLTQGFFAHLIEKSGLRAVDAERGKFRAFLLQSLKNFLADAHDRQCARKRGGGQALISIDAQDAEQRYRLEPSTTITPERLFERRWALALLDTALLRLEAEHVSAGKESLFRLLRSFLVEGVHPQSHAEVARALQMNEEAVKKASQRLRQRYQQIVREEIGHTVATASEVDEEMRHLWSVLGP